MLLSSCLKSAKKNHVIYISGNIINNSRNNYHAGGNLCRIGNKLYYNYQRGGLDYGLIEISNQNVENIYNEGFVFKDNIQLNYLFFDYKDTIYILNNGIKYFDFEKKSFLDYVKIDLDDDYSIQDICILDDNSILYTTIDKSCDEVFPVPSKLFLYDVITNKSSVIIDKSVISFCETYDKIYYVTCQGEKYYLFMYDLSSKEDLLVTTLPGYDSIYLMIDQHNNLIFNVVKEYDGDNYSRNSLYKLNLNDDVVKLDLVYSCKDYYYNYNIYNNAVYVCTESGLMKFCGGKQTLLYGRVCRECYIVDDKWVYFIDYDSKLWRVTQNGDTLEKVYG